MYCGKCGKQVEDGAKFCPQCGGALPIASQEPMQTEVVEAVEPAEMEGGGTEEVSSPVLTVDEAMEAEEDEKDVGHEDMKPGRSTENPYARKCPSCGRTIGYMDTCPDCGYSLRENGLKTENAVQTGKAKENPYASKCPSCMRTIGDSKICPYCGYSCEERSSEGNALVELIKEWFGKRSPKGKEIVISCLLVVSFVLGALFHMGVGVKSADYQAALDTNSKLESAKGKLQEQLSKEKAEYQAYKSKMQPYEEIQITDAKNKADAEKLRIEQEQQAKAEKAAAEKAAAEKAAAEAAAAKAAEEAKGYETGITYDQLARTPDDYTGKKVKFKGKVVQVLEGTNDTQIRLAVNGNYDTILYCSVPKNLTSSTRILEDDYITIMGVSTGLLSYKSTLGGTITIPGVSVNDWGPN